MTKPKPKPIDPFEEIARSLPAFSDADEVTLRQAAMRDPIRGAPLIHRSQGEDHEIEPGAWKGAGWGDRKTGLPPACPIVPLGSNGDQFFFLNTLGQVHVLTASSFGKGPIEGLFQGRTGYLEWAWPRFRMPRNRTESPRVIGYEADETRMDLINACAFEGTFDPEDKVRGRGAWRGDDGGLIYHAGDAIWIDGSWRAPGKHGRHIYPARPKIGRPGPKAAETGEGAEGHLVYEALQSWNWSRPELDPRLALGWIMTALVGGALAQRPVCFVPGPEGAGKTLLQVMIRALCQQGAVMTENATAASIYQQLHEDSLPVLADEMEAKEDTRNTDRIIELARVSFSGGAVDRGGKDGTATRYRLMSSFLFSCITTPPIDAQDASRRVSLGVSLREPGARNVLKDLGWLQSDELIDYAKVAQVGAALLKRWIDRWSTWGTLKQQIHEDLRAWGHTARSADAFAPLIGAYHLAMSDAPILDEADRAWWQARLSADVLTETSEREETWRRCLWHLLEKPTELLRESNVTYSVGALINRWREQQEAEPGALDKDDREAAKDLARKLERVGVSISFPQGYAALFKYARLWVPLKHAGLHALYEGTPWAGRLGQPGPWCGVLQQAPPTMWRKGVSRLGLNKAAKGLFLDLAAILGDSDDDKDDDRRGRA